MGKQTPSLEGRNSKGVWTERGTLHQGYYCNNVPQLLGEANIAEETNALTKMEKTDNLELIKIKNFYSSKDAIKIVY